MKLKILLILLFISSSVFSKHLYKEAEYQRSFCSKINGVLEYRLNDNSRVDCLTKTHALEFDFANKWAEAIGQSLYYSTMTNKKAGIVIIVEDKEKDTKYLKRLYTTTKKLGISVWEMTKENI